MNELAKFAIKCDVASVILFFFASVGYYFTSPKIACERDQRSKYEERFTRYERDMRYLDSIREKWPGLVNWDNIEDSESMSAYDKRALERWAGRDRIKPRLNLEPCKYLW